MTEFPDSKPGDEHVWLGSLAGFEVECRDEQDRVYLYHRCGWEYELKGPDVYLGNLIEIALGHRLRTCAGDAEWTGT